MASIANDQGGRRRIQFVAADGSRKAVRQVHSPKTEHHEGGASRLIPIFTELRPHLEAVFEQAEPGTEFVITRYRESNINRRTQLERIVRRAGLESWPKLFQNLRSTCETELAQTYPLHVVCAWIGNTRAVAAKHYLQVTDADFDRAANGGAQAAQNAAQCPHAQGRREPREGRDQNDQRLVGKLISAASQGQVSASCGVALDVRPEPWQAAGTAIRRPGGRPLHSRLQTGLWYAMGLMVTQLPVENPRGHQTAKQE